MPKFLVLSVMIFFCTVTVQAQYSENLEEHKLNHDKGLQHVNYGNYSVSIRYFTDAIENAPKDRILITSLSSYMGRGTAKYHLGDYNGALNDFNTILTLIETEHQVGRPKIDYQNKALNFKLVKNIRAKAYLLRGQTYMEMGYVEKACFDLNKAADLGSKEAAYKHKDGCGY